MINQHWPKFVPADQSNDKSALAQVMAWNQTGVKLLLEAMMTQITDI